MPIKVKKVKPQSFKDLQSIKHYCNEERQRIKYQPIGEYIENKATFMEDETFGTSSRKVQFNEIGFSDWCKLLKLSASFLEGIDKENLATQVINDYLIKENVRGKLKSYRFVVDISDDNTVLGIVSNNYQVYTNYDLLEDLNNNYKGFYKDFEMIESYVENTNLYLRLLSNDINSGIITGYEGDYPDKSRIGLQLSNSMTGKGSINIAYFIYRLVCSNGLIVDTGKVSSHIWHSGYKKTFLSRIDKRLPEVIQNIDRVREMLIRLVEIPFDEKRLVSLGGADQVYKIIPLRDYEKNIRKKLEEDKVFEFDADMMKGPIRRNKGNLSAKVFNSPYRNNQSMFDYVNLFTEFAHDPKHSLETRMDIERKTGHFVNWIYENMCG
jgi:hypothetical protein